MVEAFIVVQADSLCGGLGRRINSIEHAPSSFRIAGFDVTGSRIVERSNTLCFSVKLVPICVVCRRL